MEKKASLIVPLVIITIACLAVVEIGAWAIKRQLRQATAALGRQAVTAGTVSGPPPTAGAGYQVILARNLFGALPGGAPAPPGTAVAEAATAGGVELVLMGTVDDPVGGGRAIFLDKKSGKQQLYRPGERLSGAILEEIGRGQATLLVGGRRLVFDLAEAAKYRAAAATPEVSDPPAAEAAMAAEPGSHVSAGAPPQVGAGPSEARERRSFRLQRPVRPTAAAP